MTITYANKIASEITKLSDLTLMNSEMGAESLKCIFLHHFDNRFYEITIKPFYDTPKVEAA